VFCYLLFAIRGFPQKNDFPYLSNAFVLLVHGILGYLLFCYLCVLITQDNWVLLFAICYSGFSPEKRFFYSLFVRPYSLFLFLCVLVSVYAKRNRYTKPPPKRGYRARLLFAFSLLGILSLVGYIYFFININK